MKIRFRSLIIAAGLVAAVPLLGWAAGLYSTFPVVGGSSFCASNVSGVTLPAGQGPYGVSPGSTQGTGQGICGQTVPAGPTGITGEELIPADTQLANSTPPQTVVIPNAIIGSLNAKRNKLIGGDFATNLWQRGTTPLSAATPTTAVIGADRWYVYNSNASSQGSTVTVIKETGTADTIPASGLYASMRVQRPTSQTGTNPICVGQVLDKIAAQDLLNQNGIFSFRALAGATFSAANNNLSVSIAYYTAADSATPMTNTTAFAAGTITGYQAATAGLSTNTAGSVASGVATIPITTSWASYGVYAPVPASVSGTAVTGAGVQICDTPVGTAGATDWFEIEGAQLAVAPSIPTASLPNGITGGIGFERRPAAEEALYQQYYTSPGGLGAEVATAFYMAGLCKASGNANFPIAFPTPLREAPTTATSTLTAGGYSIETAAAVTAIGTMTIVGASQYAATLNSSAACTATLPYAVVGSAATGLILFNAEP
jgi:hypothetical protein